MQIIKNERDFFTSLFNSLEDIDPHWMGYNGAIIMGSHSPDKIGEKIELIKHARENKMPILGICLGMQLMVVEFAKNVLGWWGADSQEINPSANPAVVVKLPKLRVGIFDVDKRKESHWHNYKIEDGVADLLGVYFNVLSTWELNDYGKIVEEIKMKNHPYFVGVQYHPEYQSSKENPHPVLVEFINACKKAPKFL